MFKSRVCTGRSAIAALFIVVPIAGCDRERTAEAETPFSEAEVSTELPAATISDQQLQGAANAAAAVAAIPPSSVVVTTAVVPAPAPIAAPAADGAAIDASARANPMGADASNAAIRAGERG